MSSTMSEVFRRRPVLIGFTGRKGSGKDTSAYLTSEILDIRDMFAFADPLKTLIHGIFLKDMNVRDIEELKRSSEIVTADLTLRELYIAVGQGIKKIAGDDVYIKKMLENIDLTHCRASVIVTDVRLPEEKIALQEYAIKNGMDFTLIRVDYKNNQEEASTSITEQVIPADVEISTSTEEELREELTQYFISRGLIHE